MSNLDSNLDDIVTARIAQVAARKASYDARKEAALNRQEARMDAIMTAVCDNLGLPFLSEGAMDFREKNLKFSLYRGRLTLTVYAYPTVIDREYSNDEEDLSLSINTRNDDDLDGNAPHNIHMFIADLSVPHHDFAKVRVAMEVLGDIAAVADKAALEFNKT